MPKQEKDDKKIVNEKNALDKGANGGKKESPQQPENRSGKNGKNGRRGNGRAGGNKGQESGNKPPKDSRPKQDYQWYEINDTISKAVGNIPFNRFPGMEETVKESNDSYAAIPFRNVSPRSTPGVLVLYYGTDYGKNTAANSALNVAARSLYSWVRHRNSGHSNYEASDLMIYIAAMDEIYTAWLEAKRIYKAALTYRTMNRNTPELILAALGADGVNIRSNLAQFRAALNMIAAKISAMAVPDIFNVFKRHAFLASNIFADSTAQTSQFYAYARFIGKRFDATTEGGGSLVSYEVGVTGSRSWTQIVDELNTMIDTVLSDEDMNIMSGDILKAFGADHLYVLKEVDEYETLSFLYEENALAQIENVHMLPTGWSYPNFNLRQANNVLVSDGHPITFSVAGHAPFAFAQIMSGNTYFNSHKDEPDYKDCIEWTRNMCSCEIKSDGSGATVYYGTEAFIGGRIYSFSYASTGTRTIAYSSLHSVEEDRINTAQYVQLTKFDWHPCLYLYTMASGSPAAVQYEGCMIDLKRYTMLDSDTRQRLHDACVMGEFGSLMLEKIKQAAMN